MTSCALIVARPGGATATPHALLSLPLLASTDADDPPAIELIIIATAGDAALPSGAPLSAATPRAANLGAANPTAATPHAATAAPHDGVSHARFVDAPPDAGIAARWNAGAAVASAPYLLFLSADARPRAGWIAALLRGIEQTPRAAIAGSLLTTQDTVVSAGVVTDQDRVPHHLYAGFPASLATLRRTRRLRMVSGASLLARRDAFEAAGGFDAAFAAEDAAQDLCLRLGRDGHIIRGCHDSLVDCPLGGARYTDLDATHEPPESPAALMRSRRLFRTRWVDALHADDVEHYLQDRLLRIDYESGAPRVFVAAPLASIAASVSGGIGASTGVHGGANAGASGSADALAHRAHQVLDARAQQVRTLIEENTRLADRVAQLETSLRHATASTAAAADARSPTGATDDARASDPLVPSDALALSVGGEFQKTGDEFLTYFVDLGGLRPTDRVLDIGCGVGRMAVPLTRYLSTEGRYDGFDVMADAVAWCRTHITPRFPAFRFRHVALRNGTYNREAMIESTAFTFPYPDRAFDFIFLTSVFTHLLPAEVRHYIEEIARVLKPGGRLFSTYFLLNDDANALMRAGLSPVFTFAHRHDGYRLQDANEPEAAIAHDESRVRAWHEASGLTITDPIRYGHWCGRLDGLSLQDIVLATKA